MKPLRPFTVVPFILVAFLHFRPVAADPQGSPQEKSFFDVALSQDEVYSYTDIKFAGDYTSFESPAGTLALGRTEAGVTVLILLGGGTVRIETPEQFQDKLKSTFGAHPVSAAFNTLYMRLNPKEYEEAFGKMQLSKSADEQALAAAKAIFDERFLTSYHAGPKAIFPPYKTRVMDFDTRDFGLVTTEEGYWITLRRLMPYTSIYPSQFVNPKQK